MSVFGHAIRIINENESPLPITKLSQEPSPFDTGGCEVKSSMTYMLKKDAEKPGKGGTLFGTEKRDKGPWAFLGDPRKLIDASPGPIYNIDRTPSTIDDRDIDFNKLYEETAMAIEGAKPKDAGIMNEKSHLFQQPEPKPDSTKPRDTFAKRFHEKVFEEHVYLTGPGSYSDRTSNFAYNLLSQNTKHKKTSFGSNKSVGTPTKRKKASDLLPQSAIITTPIYCGPKIADKKRDYSRIYDDMIKNMDRERQRVNKACKIPEKPKNKAMTKLKQSQSNGRNVSKESSSFGHSRRFKSLPPDSLAHTNLPGPGAYDTKVYNIAERLGARDHIAVTKRSDLFASLKNKDRKNELKMTNIWEGSHRDQKYTLKSVSSAPTASFLGPERDTIKLMARFGKAPNLDPKPFAMDNLPPRKMQSSTMLHASHNIIAFKSPEPYKFDKQNDASTKVKLKPKDKWFSRASVPSLHKYNNVSKTPQNDKVLDNMKTQLKGKSKFNVEEIKKSFFDETKVIKGGHKEKITKLF